MHERQFFRCERTQQKKRTHRLGSELPFAAICMNDCSRLIPKVEPQDHGRGTTSHLPPTIEQPPPKQPSARAGPFQPVLKMQSDPRLDAHTRGKVIPAVRLLKCPRKLRSRICQHSLMILQVAIPRETININHTPVAGCCGEVPRLPNDRLILGQQRQTTNNRFGWFVF